MFDLLNIAAVCNNLRDFILFHNGISLQIIDDQVLCVHGGLSPDINTIDQIRTIERNQEIPCNGPFCDLVWSDPEEVDTFTVSPRGAGWLFGSKVTHEVSFVCFSTFDCMTHLASLLFAVYAHKQPGADLPGTSVGSRGFQI